MRVYTHDKRIVKLKHFQFCYLSYALLLNIQQVVPNLLIEIEPSAYPTRQSELHQFVPAYQLNLENHRALSLINT